MITRHRRRAIWVASPAAWLRTVRTTHSTLVVDYRTGSIAMLSGQARRVWNAWVEGHRPNCSEASIDTIIVDFAKRGWLTAMPQSAAPIVVDLDDSAASWGTHESPAALRTIGHAPGPWRLAAFAAVVVVLLARQLGHHYRFARLLRLTRLGAQLPPASDTQARRAVRAVRQAARLVPARVACLEESVAVTVLLAAAGKRATWCHGIATDPVRLHAWIAGANGDPIEEPASTARYTVINQPFEPRAF